MTYNIIVHAITRGVLRAAVNYTVIKIVVPAHKTPWYVRELIILFTAATACTDRVVTLKPKGMYRYIAWCTL